MVPVLNGAVSWDYDTPFLLEGGAIRGRLVRLGATLDRILGGHAYPDVIASRLAETLALAVTLAGTLKYDGVFTLQIQGAGALSLIVADVTTRGSVRGYARFDTKKLAAATNTLPDLLGKGYLAFTVDQGADSDRYQGIVELSGNSLAECAERYFEKSEQLDTAVMASVQAPSAAQPGWRAAVLMVQRMPAAEQAPIFTAEQSEEIWRRAKVLHASLRTGELFDEHLTADKLLYRLFHADGLVSFTPRPIHAECRCSPERVATVLRSFPADEIAAMRDERGHIEIVCEFCKTAYSFTQDNDGQIHLLDSSTVF